MSDLPESRATVLVVDDVEAHRYVVGSWLRRAGYDVIEATTGAEALHAAETEEIDLVTLDVNLPDMSGMEVCERIKGTPRTAALPVLHLSGTAVEVTDRNEGLRRGADAYLVEPVESDELLATINALLRYSAARRRAVRIAGYLHRLHNATLAMGAATTPRALAAAVAHGTGDVFEQAAVAVLTVGSRSLVTAVAPGGSPRTSTCPPTLPHEIAAAVAADGVLDAEALAGVEAAAAAAAAGEVECYVGAPLTDRAGAVLGAVLVAGDELPGSDDAGDARVILDQLAHAVSISIENLRAFELEHRISLTLQRSLLPVRSALPADLDVAFRYEAAAAETEVGGDFYELVELDGDQIIVAVGDVVGHSLQAAIVMSELRNGLRAYALDGYGPTEILERLDRLLRRFHKTMTATMCLVVIDKLRHRAVVANAGQVAPVVIRSTGVEFVEPHGPLLGMGLPAPAPVAVDVSGAATLLLVTDGLLERRHEIIDIGLDRLLRTAAAWEGDLDELCDRLLQEVGPGDDATDDIALLAVRVRTPDERSKPDGLSVDHGREDTGIAGSEGRPATDHDRAQTFDRHSREIARARGFVSGALVDWGLAADVAPLELMVSELVSNALVHGTGPIGVRLRRDDSTLRLEVSDEGGTTAPQVHPQVVGGWGLQFVDQLADSWGSEKRDGGTVVWVVKRTTET
jgi:serine phosphatase RsbU (regulator of sigma subunit)/CheY-like chemotaxis protein/anti-sigma regulatory factor (Ser/Thr protein kinase)